MPILARLVQLVRHMVIFPCRAGQPSGLQSASGSRDSGMSRASRLTASHGFGLTSCTIGGGIGGPTGRRRGLRPLEGHRKTDGATGPFHQCEYALCSVEGH